MKLSHTRKLKQSTLSLSTLVSVASLALFILASTITQATPAKSSCTDCYRALSETQRSVAVTRKNLALAVEKALGRTPSEIELDAIEKARGIGSFDAYTLKEIEEQEKILAEAGISQRSDLTKLRTRGVLGNFVFDGEALIPKGIQLVKGDMIHELTPAVLKAVDKTEELYYLLLQDGTMLFTKERPAYGQTILAYTRKATSAAEQDQTLIVLEAGEVHQTSEGIALAPKQTIGTVEADFETAISNLAQSTQQKVRRLTDLDEKSPMVHEVKCNQKYTDNGQTLNWKYMKDSLIGSNTVLIAGVAAGELGGDHRIIKKDAHWDSKKNLIDNIGNNLNPKGVSAVEGDFGANQYGTILNGFGGRFLILKGASLPVEYLARLAVRETEVKSQLPWYQFILKGGNDTKERALTINNFDLVESVPVVAANIIIDRALLGEWKFMNDFGQHWPTHFKNACINGNWVVAYTPTMIRIVQNGGLSLAYFWARKKFANE